MTAIQKQTTNRYSHEIIGVCGVLRVCVWRLAFTRRAFGRVCILVRVAADRGDALEAEVKERQLVAGLFHEHDQVAAKAGVHVQRHVVLDRYFGHLLDRIDRSVRILRR